MASHNVAAFEGRIAMADWADKVKALEESGWSLTDLADEIGLKPASLSDIKQGRTKASSANAYVRLHELYSKLPAGKKRAA
jgi:ribosome-binding protein aMBF1 (putative translation factor)